MIVVDTSVVVAILTREAEIELFLRSLFDAEQVLIAAPTLFETRMVLERRLAMEAVAELDALMGLVGMVCAAWTLEHAILAHDAFLRFGKGRHPAGLNFGDCMAYALAKALDAPLLFKGEDFTATDIVAAL